MKQICMKWMWYTIRAMFMGVIFEAKRVDSRECSSVILLIDGRWEFVIFDLGFES